MSNLELSLDDIIKISKKSGRASNYGPVPARRFNNRSAGRSNPYSFTKARTAETRSSDSMFAEERAAAAFYPIQGGARDLTLETGTKLLISNLDYGVTDPDINELFSDVGELKSCAVHYDRFGRSEGTAEVVFSRRADAEAAIRRYNHVQLDGKPMKIEIIGVNIGPASRLSLASFGGSSNNNGAPIRNDRVRGRGGGRGQLLGRARGVRHGRGNGRGGGTRVSAQDLDADLDMYHAAAAKETS
ncbi:THO complex subunit 4-like [Dorcoceras hygrometricum]|uniref:THO complex subunit 4-like n=1 Tax=Dorcoceras hygrometricum TaxID=472368 RepID=A0A2Z7BRY3_9LAMI|nr:THO complex subunit 4-like [Dorcoceras hygrometricum]